MIKYFFKLAVIFFALPLIAKNSFISIDKSGVNYQIARTNDGTWIDSFFEKDFKEWENDTFEVFERVKDKGGIAIDLGAWVGTTSIWLSKHFAYVVAVEPDQESLKYLVKNLRASKCRNVVIYNHPITLHGNPVIFGPRANEFGDTLNSSTSMVKSKVNADHDYGIVSSTFQKMIEDTVIQNDALNRHKISFIKCDIEGGEELILEDILEFAYKNKSKVWMSFHVKWWSEKKIADYQKLFKKFKTNCPNNDVVAYINETPMGSVLFEP